MDRVFTGRTTAIRTIIGVLVAAGVFVVLLQISRWNYLLFHALTEMYSVAVAVGIFMVAWNARRLANVPFVLVLGVGYLFIGGVDLLHTLAYQGMGVFGRANTNLATQFWVAGRYLECLSLVLAFSLGTRRPSEYWLVGGFAAATALLLLSILVWGIFPVCFDAETGLTAFKKASEFGVVALAAVALGLLWRQRGNFDTEVLWCLSGSIVMTMASELAFTMYRRNPFGVYNETGHYLKLASYYLVYRAIMQNGLRRPYGLLFRDLKRNQEQLQEARDDLERRVQHRTAELSQTVTALQEEVQERLRYQEGLRQSERRLYSVLNMLPGYVSLIDERWRVRFANHRFLTVTDDGVGLAGAEAGEGLGMRTMRYRAGVMNGRLEIQSGPEGGTVVKCAVPVGQGRPDGSTP